MGRTAPRIATVRLADGAEIAYARSGSGPLMVYVPGWLTHLERSWTMPPERAYYEALSAGRTLIRYDRPGTGMSGAYNRPYTFDLEIATLGAVIDAVDADRYDLIGASLGAAVAAAWAARHPGAVHRLGLYGGWARGADLAPPEVREHVLALLAAHWGLGSDVLTEIFAPDADADTPARRSPSTSARHRVPRPPGRCWRCLTRSTSPRSFRT